MTPTTYRKRVQAEVDAERAARAAGPPGPEHTVHFPDLYGAALDPARSADDRFEALVQAQTATFLPEAVEPHRADWLAALRTLAEDDDPRLRDRATEILVAAGDPHIQEALLATLRDPANARIRPDRALRLLATDLHSEVLLHARRLAREADDPAVREQALRTLGADPESAGLLETVADDPAEAPSARSVALLGLGALAPERQHRVARKLALEDATPSAVRATSLTTLAARAEPVDDELAARARSLRRTGPNAVRKAAKRLLPDE